MPNFLGHILLIANPAAQSGAGAAAAERAAANLRAALGANVVTVARTAGPRHACAIAEAAEGAQTVVALGGDGVIHEVVNGLMKRQQSTRPQLGVIPVGSGNDYARSLGIPADVDKACKALLATRPKPTDVGCVNGEYFAETLSFGVDAAIALDTMERRKRTGKHGTALYMASGFDQLFHHLDERSYHLQLDGGPVLEGKSITFAVQMGPFYGGGFNICPGAQLDDGLLDLCISHPPISPAGAAAIFLMAKGGNHTGLKRMEFHQARQVHVEFEAAPPAQVDGERIEAKSFDAEVVPAALQVLR